MNKKNQYQNNSLLLNVNFTLTTIYLGWAMVPYLYRNIPKVTIPILLILWITSAILSFKTRIKVNSFAILVIFWSLMLIVYYMPRMNITASGNLYVSILYFFPMFIFMFYHRISESKYFKWILYVTFFIVAVNSITNLIIFAKDPYASKYLTGDIYGTMIERYRNTNLASISFVNPVALVIPVIISRVKSIKRKTFKTILICILVISFIFVIKACSFITLIALLVEVLMIFLWTKDKEMNIIYTLISVILFVIIIFFQTDVGRFLLNTSLNVNNIQYGIRLQELGNFFLNQSDSGSLTLRLNYIKLSFTTFLNHPIFGTGMIYNINYLETGVGMHSQIIDDLARYGMIGLFFYVLIYSSFFKYVFINIQNINTKKVVKICIIGGILLSLFNISIEPAFASMMFLVIPTYGTLFKYNSE